MDEALDFRSHHLQNRCTPRVFPLTQPNHLPHHFLAMKALLLQAWLKEVAPQEEELHPQVVEEELIF